MERRMKGGYLDQQVPYTFCSVSASLASTPAPIPRPPRPDPQSLTRGLSRVLGSPSPESPGNPSPAPQARRPQGDLGAFFAFPQKSPGNGSLREALMVPQGKLMDPGSLPPPDSEGKKKKRAGETNRDPPHLSHPERRS